MSVFKYAIIIFLLLVHLNARGYEPFLSFSASKSELIKIYAKHKLLPLSGCQYRFDPKGCSLLGIVDFSTCDYKVSKDTIQAKQVDWMHVMMPSEFGKTLDCMKEKICQSSYSGKIYKGIRCCKQHSALFRQMYADMHNIIPVNGEYTTIRNNRTFVDRSDFYSLEPRISAKGEVARSYLYMIDRYKLTIEKTLITLWQQWNKEFPPTLWEKSKNKQIFELQGNANTYIEALEN